MSDWTLGNVGNSPGPSSGDRHKPDGQIDFTPTWEDARQDVPYEHDFHKLADVNHAWGRVDVPDANLPHVTPIDLGSVAPYQSEPDVRLDGQSGGGNTMPSVLD